MKSIKVTLGNACFSLRRIGYSRTEPGRMFGLERSKPPHTKKDPELL